MNAAPLRRPLGCLKNALRHARQQNPGRRTYSMAISDSTPPSSETIASLLPENTWYRAYRPHSRNLKSAFAVYAPRAPTTTAPGSGPPAAPIPRDPLPALHARQIAQQDPTGARTRLFAKTREAARAGDVLMVTTRKGEPFSGVVLSIKRAGIDTAVLLRGQLSRVGVEMWYKIYSANVLGVEIVHRRPKRARRARLTYMRKPQHDMGSVDHLVAHWKRTRNVLRTKGGAKKADAKARAAKK